MVLPRSSHNYRGATRDQRSDSLKGQTWEEGTNKVHRATWKNGGIPRLDGVDRECCTP